MNPTDILDWPADPIGYAHASMWPVRLAKEDFKRPGLGVSYATNLFLMDDQIPPRLPTTNLHRRVGVCFVHVYGSLDNPTVTMACYQRNVRFKLPRLLCSWTCGPGLVIRIYLALKPVLKLISGADFEFEASSKIMLALTSFETADLVTMTRCPF